jgi:hypothetical protein
MSKAKLIPCHDIVVVDLKEREWVKVIEIPLPADLFWLARIGMLQPVKFEREELGLLVYTLREHAETVRQRKDRLLIERIADKMAEAMQTPATGRRTKLATNSTVPNDKPSALRAMRQDLRLFKKQNPHDPMVALLEKQFRNIPKKSLAQRLTALL